MKKGTFLFFLLTIVCLAGFSQRVYVKANVVDKETSPSSDTIYYAMDRPITWDDFQGKAEENSIAGAVTSSGFGYGAAITTTEDAIYINLNVYTYFSRSRSWKKSMIHSDYHLEHEQHHCDITMLGAEEFCNAIREAHFTANNYKQLIAEIFDKMFNENTELQETYDSQTEHSINREMQFAWNKKINETMGRIVGTQ
jgi:hypothetical protein